MVVKTRKITLCRSPSFFALAPSTLTDLNNDYFLNTKRDNDQLSELELYR